ncbi:MAG: iron-sulfur cluster assembly protein [Gammaproteobacteria bacterium]|nr:iron-sulfur cluster assembly protein [Gammaproteobacteria bacterium]
MPAPVTEEDVYQALKTVFDPELRHDIVALGFVQDIDIVGDYVHLDIQLTTPHCPYAEQIVRSIREAVGAIEGVTKVDVERACMKEE